ncbi:MAG TPA: VanZ family protein [Burkholderiaceae bacterium]|nr:VanZ family protein [Burkholderiaceae bacterium]
MRTSRDYLLQLLTKPLPRQRWLALALLVSAATYLIWHSSDHTAASPFSPPWDKIVHFVFFAGLACLGWVVVGGSGNWSSLVVLMIAAGIGAADEVTQGMNPLRVMDLEDLIADVAGALAAIVVLTRISGRLRRQGAGLRAADQPAR